MIAICDCNSFYTACHQLGDATLWNKPIIAMSNNDQIIVSLNPRAKKLGLSRGMAKFEIQPIIKQHDVRWFSPNYELYGDISNRVMYTIAGCVARYEKFS